MRAPLNDTMNVWTPILSGGPNPLVAVLPCRFVAADQITDTQFPFNQRAGYVTFDPPNFLNAAIVTFVGGGFMNVDYWLGNLIEVATQPGVLYYIDRIEVVATLTDLYYRAWLIDSTVF